MRKRVIMHNGRRVIAFKHETDDQARERHARIESARMALDECSDPLVALTYLNVQAKRDRQDADNTVAVSSGRHVLPDTLAERLAHRLSRLATEAEIRAYQMAQREAATLLGVHLAEVADVVSQLKAARLKRAQARLATR